DIAIPRDIEPEVGQLDDVYLYTIDDLEQVVSDNVDSREKEKVLAQEIIVKQAQVFNKWLSVLPNEQLVQSYRTSANQIKDDIVLDAIKRLNNGDDGEKIIKKLADQLTNKILHTTFKNIKQTAHTDLSQCEGCVPNIKK
ncbi:MAG: glutamyl-tRNA reductase, partial [Candidatus Thioglobus sp.]|nr:glutamyl-tRNA reductase [Candidatus Thioglobus sp.]